MRRVIGLYFETNLCNLNCSYCYINKSSNKKQTIKHSLEDVKKAFQLERLSGKCFVNVSSNGEPLLIDNITDIIKIIADEGHYLMVVTNGTITSSFDRILDLPIEIQSRIFIKFSFHYEELKRSGMLDVFFKNFRNIVDSPCSCSLEMMATDETLILADEIKEVCIKEIGALPHLSIARDERQYNLGLLSTYTFENYVRKWKEKSYHSTFFDFKSETYGKQVDYYCDAGIKSVSVEYDTGRIKQCYHTPVIGNFFDFNEEIDFFPIGKNCPEAHCYVSHMFMTLGVLAPPKGVEKMSYYEMRNRQGTNWIKEEIANAFKEGLEKEKTSKEQKLEYERKNSLLDWRWRKESRLFLQKKLLLAWLELKISNPKAIEEYMRINNLSKVAIFGYGENGKLLYKELQEVGIDVKFIIDNNKEKLSVSIENIKIVSPEEEFDDVDVIIVSPVKEYYEIKKQLQKKTKINILSIEDLIYGSSLIKKR